MKNSKIYAIAAGLLAFASCAEQPIVYPDADFQEQSFFVTIDSALPMPFEAGDAISIYDGTTAQKFVTDESGMSANFKGIADASVSEYSAIYPYTSSLRNKNRIRFNVPASQEGVSRGVDPAARIAVGHTTNGNLVLKNVLAFLKVTIKVPYQYTVVSVNVSTVAGEPISGSIFASLERNPVVTPYSTGVSSQVNLSGDDLYGTYYIAVAPQHLSEGLKVAYTNSEDGRYEVVLPEIKDLNMNEIVDLGELGDVEWVEGINPEPTSVDGAVVLHATFKGAEFNMVSEGDFEDYTDKPIFYRTAWIPINGADQYVDYYTPGYEGNVSCLFNGSPTGGVWLDLNQFMAVPQNTDMVMSFQQSVNTPYSRNAFIGEGPGELWLAEYSGHDMAEWDYSGYYAWSPTDPATYTLEFNTRSYYWGIVVFSIAGDPGRYEVLDDVKVYPKDYVGRSMATESVKLAGSFRNATFDDVTETDKIVAWRNELGTISLAFSKPVVRGALYDNAMAYADPQTLTINKFHKASGKLMPILDTKDADIVSVVPEAVFVHDGKSYLYYGAKNSELDENNWTTKYSGFLVSEDGGASWQLPSHGKRWNVDLSVSPYEWFSQASICQGEDGYFYMVHSKYGRDWSNYGNFFISRCPDTKDFTDPDEWEHWTGTMWSSNAADLSGASLITVGNVSEPCLVYNKAFGRFMLIYRSERHQALVYRDAATVDGAWSGEKILVDDDAFGRCIAPVITVNEDGSLDIVTSLM